MDYRVKNGSAVAKAFKVRGGHEVVPAGKEADVVDAKDLTEAQIEAFEREGVKVKVLGGKAKSEPEQSGSDAAKTPTEVLAMADDPAIPFMSFKAAAAKLLGDATPAKKDEIVAALKAL